MTDTENELQSSQAKNPWTPGPWAWFGSASPYDPRVYLATRHSGRRYVMEFTRWGMRGAQPRFQPGKQGMVPAKDLLQFEVGDGSVVGIEAARKDNSVYRYDIRGIDCADARLIAAAPEVAEALCEVLACVDRANNEPLATDVIDRAKAALAKARGETR